MLIKDQIKDSRSKKMPPKPQLKVENAKWEVGEVTIRPGSRRRAKCSEISLESQTISQAKALAAKVHSSLDPPKSGWN